MTMQTVIIGGGTIGLLSAYELRRRGRSVVVIDKGEPGQGASAGNAGWITPSLSGPVPAPGIVAQSIRWMLRPDSPLYIRPASVPRMLSWLISFWRHCGERYYRAGFTALAEFNRTTMRDFDALKAAGLDFEMHSDGLLFVCQEEKTIQRLMREFNELAAYDFGEPVHYTREETLDLEPALQPVVKGSVWMPRERHVRPESLNAAVLDWLRRNGVDVRTGTKVTRLALQKGRVRGVETTQGFVEAEQVLIATGAEAAELARQADFYLPMQAGKGYSITVDDPVLKLGRPMYMEEVRVAVSPYNGALRIAGTMELSGVNNVLDSRRVEAIRRGATRFLGDWEAGKSSRAWVGMRPMLPDGLPAIGRAPGYDNLFVASGHAMLGITLGPTTAVAIAQLMNEEPLEFNLKPFDPGRFN